jgi:hypothetical protein
MIGSSTSVNTTEYGTKDSIIAQCDFGFTCLLFLSELALLIINSDNFWTEDYEDKKLSILQQHCIWYLLLKSVIPKFLWSVYFRMVPSHLVKFPLIMHKKPAIICLHYAIGRYLIYECMAWFIDSEKLRGRLHKTNIASFTTWIHRSSLVQL